MTASEHPVITDDTIPLELKVILFKGAQTNEIMALMRDILSKTAHKVSDREYFARAHKIGTRATNVTMKK